MTEAKRGALEAKGAAFLALVDAVNRVHFRLFKEASDLHADLGLHVGHRAVLRDLVERGPATAPQLAAMRPVARQYMQRLIDDLNAMGLVTFKTNPAHRRSRFVAATAKGRRAFAAMQVREQARFAPLVTDLDARVLTEARDVLCGILDGLDAL